MVTSFSGIPAVLFGIVLAAAIPAYAQVAPPAALPPNVKLFVESCRRSRQGMIAQLEFKLRGLQSGAATARRREGKIEAIQADLAALRAGKQIVVPVIAFPSEVGAIGRLPGGGAHVLSVSGEDEMLVRCSFDVKVAVTEHFRSRLASVAVPVVFRVRGVPTTDATPGADVPLAGVFEIVGRETYRAEGGQSETALVVKPFDMGQVEPLLRGAK